MSKETFTVATTGTAPVTYASAVLCAVLDMQRLKLDDTFAGLIMMTHLHGADHLDLSHIPQLRLAIVGADRQVSPPLTPGHRAHAILGLAAAEVAQLGDLAGAGRPQVHTGAQTHC